MGIQKSSKYCSVLLGSFKSLQDLSSVNKRAFQEPLVEIFNFPSQTYQNIALSGCRNQFVRCNNIQFVIGASSIIGPQNAVGTCNGPLNGGKETRGPSELLRVRRRHRTLRTAKPGR